MAVVLAATVALGAPATAHAAPPVVSFTASVTDSTLITLNWTVSGGNASGLLYIYDVGFRPQDCTPEADKRCSTTVRAKRSGVHRYTLSVQNDANEFTNVTVEATVASLQRPTVPARRVHVDQLAIQPQTLSWSHAVTGPVDRFFVQIRRPGSMFAIGQGLDGLPGTKFPLNGSYPVPVNDLPIGQSTWSVSYCEQPVAGQPALCSATTPVTFSVEPAQLSGPFRRFAPTNQSLTLSWSGSGNMWNVSAPSLGFSQWTSTPTVTIPAASMVAGVHDIKVTSCLYGGACSNRVDVKASAAGTIHHAVATGGFAPAGTTVAVLTPDGGGAPVNLTAARTGAYSSAVAEGAHVGINELVGYVLTEDVDATQVVVGGGTSAVNWTSRSIGTDFTAARYDTTTRPASGSPLDITIDSSGDVWEVGEFGTSAAVVDDGVLTDRTAPVGRLWNAGTGVYEPTSPFRSAFGDHPPSEASTLVERVVDTGSAIWFAQAGDYAGPNNHSRLIRFDRNGTDNPATPDDDRICAVHVPGDVNEVIGLAHDPATNRIWFSEKANSGRPAAVSWFVDGDLACNNSLQYQVWGTNAQGQPAKVQNTAGIAAAATANLCAGAVTAHCIHRIDLPATASVPGHIVVDSTSGFLWIANYTGTVLSRYPLAGGAVQSFPLPTPVRPGWYGGFPWQIRADATGVYLNEYGDSQLLRFDKSIANPAVACAALVGGKNPCISELFVPMAGPDVNVHSIALRNGKLWFSVANEGAGEDANGSYVGYVDVASWAAGSPTGVVYNDLASLGAPPASDHWSVRGIEVSAAGKVALADMNNQIAVLTPR